MSDIVFARYRVGFFASHKAPPTCRNSRRQRHLIGQTSPYSRFFLTFVATMSPVFKTILVIALAAMPIFQLAANGICAAADTAKASDADDSNRYTMRSNMIGIGGTNRLETYLSPFEYKGTELRFMHESMRLTKMKGGRISTQQFFEGNISHSKSPTNDASYLAGDFEWRIAWHYNWQPLPGLRLLAGAQTGASIGGVYNTRNGNNPAQAKLSADIAASGMAIYRFPLLGRTFSARYQFDMPLVGLMFSPAFGQSYYEIFSLNHYDNNVCPTWLGNAPTFRNLLTLDAPLGSGTLRIGWRCDIRQSHVNQLKSHAWSNLFMIGYVKHFRLMKRGDNGSNKTIL